jgi:hypothetical protein
MPSSESSNKGQVIRYYAHTPAGTMLAHTQHRTREGCIAILMADLHKHNMPYPDWAAAEKRGYSIEEWEF